MKRNILCILFLVSALCAFADNKNRDYLLGKWKFEDNTIIRIIGIKEGVDFYIDTFIPQDIDGTIEFYKKKVCFLKKGERYFGDFHIYDHKVVVSGFYIDIFFEDANVIPFMHKNLTLVLYKINENKCKYCIYNSLIASVYTGELIRIIE